MTNITQKIRTLDGRQNGGWSFWARYELWVRQPLFVNCVSHVNKAPRPLSTCYMDNITLIMILRHKPHLGVTNQIQGALRRKPLSSRICCVRSPRVPHGDHRCQQSGQNTQQTFPCLQDGLWTFNTGYVTHGSRLHRKCVQQIGEDLNRAA